jgi:hypothetical protein
MGECGRQLVAERFDFSKYITGLEELFRDAISQPELAGFA